LTTRRQLASTGWCALSQKIGLVPDGERWQVQPLAHGCQHHRAVVGTRCALKSAGPREGCYHQARPPYVSQTDTRKQVVVAPVPIGDPQPAVTTLIVFPCDLAAGRAAY